MEVISTGAAGAASAEVPPGDKRPNKQEERREFAVKTGHLEFNTHSF